MENKKQILSNHILNEEDLKIVTGAGDGFEGFYQSLIGKVEDADEGGTVEPNDDLTRVNVDFTVFQ